MPTLIQTKEQELAAKQKSLQELAHDAQEGKWDANKWEEFDRQKEEVKTLGADLTRLKEAAAQEAEMKAAQDRYNAPNYPGFQPSNGQTGAGGGQGQIERKSLGEIVTGSMQYKMRSAQRDSFFLDTEAFPDVKEAFSAAGFSVKNFVPNFETKTAVTEGSSFVPPNPRTSVIVPMVFNKPDIIDFLPQQMTNLQIIKFMEGTTWTANASLPGEGTAGTDSAYAWTERTDTVQKVIGWVPVTDEQLADVPELMGILNNQLGLEVRIKLQDEVVAGNNTGSELNGFLNRVTQAQAKSTDATPDAIYKAMTLIRYTGRAEPDGIIMHPNDWQDIQLLKDQIGHYIWGDPSNQAAMPSIWGLPVIVNTSETQNTALVGAFRDYSTLYMREELTVETGYVDTDFTKAQKTVRAVLRAALQVRRLNAFCKVTGI